MTCPLRSNAAARVVSKVASGASSSPAVAIGVTTASVTSSSGEVVGGGRSSRAATNSATVRFTLERVWSPPISLRAALEKTLRGTARTHSTGR